MNTQIIEVKINGRVITDIGCDVKSNPMIERGKFFYQPKHTEHSPYGVPIFHNAYVMMNPVDINGITEDDIKIIKEALKQTK